MLFQSCQTATKSFLLQNSLMGVGIRPAPTKKQRKRIATPVTSVTGSQSANYLLIVKTSQQQRRQLSKRFPRATPTSWQNLRIYLIRASSRRKNLTRRKSSCWDCKKLSAGSKSLPAFSSLQQSNVFICCRSADVAEPRRADCRGVPRPGPRGKTSVCAVGAGLVPARFAGHRSLSAGDS